MFSFKAKVDKTPASKDGQPTDGSLLRRAANGEESAFEQLYQRYAKRLLAFLLPRLGGDIGLAKDFRQQVFLQLLESKVYTAAAKQIAQEDLSGLLFTIAANLLKNNHRSLNRRQQREITYQKLNASAEVESGEARIDPAIFQWAKAQLSEDQQLCLRLRFQRGMSIGQIAELIGKPEGTVKSRLHYGLEKLRNCLNDQR